MRPEEQLKDAPRYTVVPRTLIFLTRGTQVLLLRGAPEKKLWANRYNGLGGHIEPGEDPRAAALRELQEEAGIIPATLELRALIHVTRPEPPGIMLFVFVGTASTQTFQASAEGTVEWVELETLATLPVVTDLPTLLPRLLTSEGVVFGRYLFTAAGLEMHLDCV